MEAVVGGDEVVERGQGPSEMPVAELPPIVTQSLSSLPFHLVPHCDCPRLEFQSADELQVESLR